MRYNIYSKPHNTNFSLRQRRTKTALRALSVRLQAARLAALDLHNPTINYAEILGAADRVGSIAVGRDADFALFSGDPLGLTVTPDFVIVGGKAAYKK